MTWWKHFPIIVYLRAEDGWLTLVPLPYAGKCLPQVCHVCPVPVPAAVWWAGRQQEAARTGEHWACCEDQEPAGYDW